MQTYKTVIHFIRSVFFYQKYNFTSTDTLNSNLHSFNT